MLVYLYTCMNESKGLKYYLSVFVKGMGMGAADVVPGVSGGTVAFITGIYQDLLNSIKSFSPQLFKIFKQDGIKGVWNAVNASFLVALLAGIATSVISLAGFISGILNEKGETMAKINLWSFFFGLIVASVIYIAKQVKQWNLKNILGLVSGVLIAYYITVAPVSADNEGYVFLFFAGALAITAMILPGISGSFILVLLGAYQPIMNAIGSIKDGLKDKDFSIVLDAGSKIGVAGLGCIIGLLSFSRVLSWLFKNHERITLAVLTGFMIGSLNKIWPWKEVTLYQLSSKGEEKPILTSNLSPVTYLDKYPYMEDSGVLNAIVFAIIGVVLVFGLEFLGKKMGKPQEN
ncbi:MAG: hypothetical protein RLZZ414_1235 [Bacteroidota bacterium]